MTADFSAWLSTLPRPPGKSSSTDQSCKNAQENGQRRDGRHGEKGQQAVPGDTGGWMGFCHSCLESCHTLALLSGYSLTFWHQPQASHCELPTNPPHVTDCFPVLNAPLPGFLSRQPLSSTGPWHALFLLPESCLSLPHSGVLDSTSYATFVLYIETSVCCLHMCFSSTELSRC